MSRILLPGDFVTAYSHSNITNEERITGAGLEKRSDGIYAVIPGVLRETNDKLWIVTSNKRYVPRAGDRVLGTVTARIGDYFRVDIGSADLALLNFLSFEGATKRNRPNVKVGDLIFGQILLTSKHMEPEISCVDLESRSRGLGVINLPGIIINVTLNHARKLLSADDDFLQKLGKHIKFEIAIGMNGKIWLSGQTREVLAVRDAILTDETTYDKNRDLLIEKTIKQM